MAHCLCVQWDFRWSHIVLFTKCVEISVCMPLSIVFIVHLTPYTMHIYHTPPLALTLTSFCCDKVLVQVVHT